MIVDGHLHLIKGKADELIRDMDTLHIDKTVIVSVSLKDMSRVKIPPKFFLQNRLFVTTIGVCLEQRMAESRDFRDNLLSKPDNTFIFEACATYPGRLYGFIFINPNDPAVMDELRLYVSDSHCKGIKMAQRQYPVDLGGKRMRDIAQFGCEHSLPIFIHLGFEKQTYDIEPLALAFPDLVIIVAHMGIQYFTKALGWSARFKNVYLDSSSNFATSKMVEKAVSRVGAEKIFMGSDMPILGDQPTALNKISRAKISEAEKRLIMGENIATLLKLKGH